MEPFFKLATIPSSVNVPDLLIRDENSPCDNNWVNLFWTQMSSFTGQGKCLYFGTSRSVCGPVGGSSRTECDFANPAAEAEAAGPFYSSAGRYVQTFVSFADSRERSLVRSGEFARSLTQDPCQVFGKKTLLTGQRAWRTIQEAAVCDSCGERRTGHEPWSHSDPGWYFGMG